MKKYEYKTKHVSPEDYKYHLNEDKFLNDMGEKGWELVGVVNKQDSTVFPVFYYFKREIIK